MQTFSTSDSVGTPLISVPDSKKVVGYFSCAEGKVKVPILLVLEYIFSILIPTGNRNTSLHCNVFYKYDLFYHLVEQQTQYGYFSVTFCYVLNIETWQSKIYNFKQ